MSLERRVIETEDFRYCLKVDPRDGEPVADLLQGHCRARVDPGRCEPRARELSDQRHREAAGMRGADELFRIGGGLSVFEARLERVWTFEGPAADGESAAALDEIALPFCFGFPAWHDNVSSRPCCSSVSDARGRLGGFQFGPAAMPGDHLSVTVQREAALLIEVAFERRQRSRPNQGQLLALVLPEINPRATSSHGRVDEECRAKLLVEDELAQRLLHSRLA